MYLKYAETGNKHGNPCKVYGNLTYSKCSILGVYLHLMANRGKSSGQTCLFEYHNDPFFCLACEDMGISKTKIKDWNYPSLSNKRENIRNINNLNDDLA